MVRVLLPNLNQGGYLRLVSAILVRVGTEKVGQFGPFYLQLGGTESFFHFYFKLGETLGDHDRFFGVKIGGSRYEKVSTVGEIRDFKPRRVLHLSEGLERGQTLFRTTMGFLEQEKGAKNISGIQEERRGVYQIEGADYKYITKRRRGEKTPVPNQGRG